jgi:hypothetical protein
MASSARGPFIAATIGLIALGFVPACGGASKHASAETSTPSSKSRGSGSGDRLGCGEYCQSAGGYGGTPGGQDAITVASTGTVSPDADGYVPVTLKCNIPMQCRGAMILSLKPFRADGRSDILVGAGDTRTIAVPLPPAILAYLEDHGTTTLDVAGDVKVPPCDQIPEMAAACAKFKQSPGYTPDQGDGITRYVMGKLTVKPR